MATLDIWVRDERAAALTYDPQTHLFALQYAPGWLAAPDGFALSPQLPLRRPAGETPEQHSAQARQFFENLLPEGEALDHAARAAGTSRSNLVGLLVHVGRETAGALRVALAGAPPHDVDGGDALTEITAAQLSQRIRQRDELPFSVWDGRVRLSIAGYQDKIAVYEQDGRWYLVNSGALASTQIVKPVPQRALLANLPAVEHMSMTLAGLAGLAVAPTRLVHVPQAVLLVRRFDRARAADAVHRLHVIDGCQALGLPVGLKYERAYGDAPEVAHLRDGVSLPLLFSLVDQSAVPAVDRRDLLRWVIFQVLIGNTDAHGKNVSFFCDAQGLRLAPAYDLVCMPALDAGFSDQYAMAIGDAFSQAQLSPYEWAHFGYLCRLPVRLIALELDGMITRIRAAMDRLVAAMKAEGVDEALVRRFRDVVLGLCERQQAHVAHIARFKRSDFE